MIRQAHIRDVQRIAGIVNDHASKGLMLPIALTQIYDQLRDFYVAIDGNEIVGAGAMHVAWEDLGEIRSVAIAADRHRRGIGTKLVEKLLQDARDIEIAKVFILTYQVDFFKKFGFRTVDRESLPHRIWRICLNCPKFPDCDETAMMLEL